MTYRSALAFLALHANFETRSRGRCRVRFTLDRMRHVLALLEHPERSFRSVIVGGTNGKGSTAAMLAGVLHGAGGIRTGLYTSPHLVDCTERIAINGMPVSKRLFAHGVALVKKCMEASSWGRSAQRTLTYFELLTAVAFVVFREEHIECAVLEVGLGGRLDATNVAPAMGAIITSISFDHRDVLGRTLTAIAREKAGIIKRHRWVVVAPQERSAANVIARVVQKRQAQLVTIGQRWAVRKLQRTGYGWRCSFGTWRTVRIPLRGTTQPENAALALTACSLVMHALGKNVSAHAVRRALYAVRWPGRFETIAQAPDIVIDGAHNEGGMRSLIASLALWYPRRRVILIMGVSRDKEYERMLDVLAPTGCQLIVTEARHPRACPVGLLSMAAQQRGMAVQAIASPMRALRAARRMSSPDTVIVVAGSLFLVGMLRTMLRGSSIQYILKEGRI